MTDAPHIGIVGLGYVGLPLAVAFAQAGCRVSAVDISAFGCVEVDFEPDLARANELDLGP